jgi:hypothetical protein
MLGLGGAAFVIVNVNDVEKDNGSVSDTTRFIVYVPVSATAIEVTSIVNTDGSEKMPPGIETAEPPL